MDRVKQIFISSILVVNFLSTPVILFASDENSTSFCFSLVKSLHATTTFCLISFYCFFVITIK